MALPFVDNLVKKVHSNTPSYLIFSDFALQSTAELSQLDVQLRYEDYAALFDKASAQRNPIVERQRVLFEHFMTELQELKGAHDAHHPRD